MVKGNAKPLKVRCYRMIDIYNMFNFHCVPMIKNELIHFNSIEHSINDKTLLRLSTFVRSLTGICETREQTC